MSSVADLPTEEFQDFSLVLVAGAEANHPMNILSHHRGIANSKG